MWRLLCVVIVAVLLAPNSDAMHVKLKALKCFVDRPDLGSIKLCFVKALSRDLSTFNLLVDLNGTFWGPIFVEVVVYYRYGTIFRQVIKPPVFEWCSSVESLSSNIYLQSVYDVLKDTAPQMFQKCPYKGQFRLTNVTFDISKYPAPFPQGTYKTSLNLSHGNHGQAGWGFMITEVTSELKHSF